MISMEIPFVVRVLISFPFNVDAFIIKIRVHYNIVGSHRRFSIYILSPCFITENVIITNIIVIVNTQISDDNHIITVIVINRYWS